MKRGRGALKACLLVGLLVCASGSALITGPAGAQEPDPIEAGLAPTGLPYAPGFDVLHYDFELALSEGDESFLGRAQVRLALLQPLPETIGPFPFEKLANVQSSTRFGGMENASAIFYSERGIANNTDDGVVAHEIAHQWFGDAVTEARWSHLWLSEGFATYFGALFFEQAVGVDDFRRRMEGSRQIYIRSGVTAQPVVREEESLFDLLNRNNYEKGGWVLHMLRGRLGDEAFFRGIREYYRRYRHRAVLTEDFQAVMEEASGQDLDWFFRQWLLEPGYPILQISHEWVEANREIVLTVEQVQDGAWPTFRFQTEVEIELSTGTTRTPVEISARRSVIRIEAAESPRTVRFDPDGWVLSN